MTDKIEFCPLVNLKTDPIERLIEKWQFDLNWHRPHSSSGGKTPIYTYNEEVGNLYTRKKSTFQQKEYKLEIRTRKLKRS